MCLFYVGGLGQSPVRVRSEIVVKRRFDQNPDVCEQMHQIHGVRQAKSGFQTNEGKALANDGTHSGKGMVQGSGKSLCLLSQGASVFVIFCAKSHFRFER